MTTITNDAPRPDDQGAPTTPEPSRTAAGRTVAPTTGTRRARLLGSWSL